MKILIIPSWYPTPDNEVKGSFFREQSLLFSHDFDIFTLAISPVEVGFFKFLLNLFKRKNKYYSIQKPPEGTGVYYLQLKNSKMLSMIEPISVLIEKINYKIMCKLSFLSLMKELDKLHWKPDLIHAHSVVNGGVFANYLSFKFKVPYIITEHQGLLIQDVSKFKKKIIFQSLKEAKKVLTVSEHLKRQILMNGISIKPVVVGNLVDDALFDIQSEPSVAFKILTVTYNAYIKDNDTLFKCIKLLISKGLSDFKVLIIGGDLEDYTKVDKQNPLYIQAQKYGLTDYVEILNWVERIKMPFYYNKCNVFVSTSIAETFGVAQCEAMMCGLPVIATANGGIDDIINDSNGIKIPIQDHEALANAIIKIKNSEIQFKPEIIRSSVINKFGPVAFKSKILEIYNNL